MAGLLLTGLADQEVRAGVGDLRAEGPRYQAVSSQVFQLGQQLGVHAYRSVCLAHLRIGVGITWEPAA